MDIDDTISRLKKGEIIIESKVIEIFEKMMELLSKEPNVLSLQHPIIICGDIHGQFDDLLQLFQTVEDKKDTYNFLFMGDYVDRGHHSMNTFLFLCCHKIKYPHRYHLLRGNHESRQVTRMYGFYNECVAYYGHDATYSFCNSVFDLLPLAAVIDKQIFSVHGGLSPDIFYIDQISLLERQDEIPSEGPMADLCWSDPENIGNFHPNTRGAGFLFGPNEVQKFNQINHIKLITRSHQLALEGYQFFFPVDKSKPKPEPQNDVLRFGKSEDLPGPLVTIWSAPNYSYRTLNRASVLVLDDKGYQIRIFDSNPVRIEPAYPQVSGSIYFT